MDLKELQRLLEKEKGKVVIVENGRPIMVITPYEQVMGSDANSDEQLEGIEEAEPEPEFADSGPQELTIDDLPL